MYHLAVDLYGGDHGPPVILPAALAFLARHPDTSLTLFGDARLTPAWQFLEGRQLTPRLQWEHAQPNASPESGIRTLYHPDYRCEALASALTEHGRGRFDAVVTAADTRLLIVRARQCLESSAAIRTRPVLSAWLPTLQGRALVVDAGAMLTHQDNDLLAAALAAHRFLSLVRPGYRPRTGVLNIGTEPGKARARREPLLRALASTASLDLVGYVEPQDVLDGQVDLVITDGFSGNVMLKSMTASVHFARGRVASALSRTWVRRALGLALGSLMRADLAALNPEEYNGAPLLGVSGWVVKSHGSAGARAFECALGQARQHVRQGIPTQLRQAATAD